MNCIKVALEDLPNKKSTKVSQATLSAVGAAVEGAKSTFFLQKKVTFFCTKKYFLLQKKVTFFCKKK